MEALTAKAEMLIKAPRAKAFFAFTDSETICKFWLDHSNGDLVANAKVEWTFMVPGAKDTVEVVAFKQDAFLKFKWSDGSIVEISFRDHALQATRVSVTVRGLKDAESAVGTTEGFAIVLCDLKSFLETGVSGGMVRDKALLIAHCKAKD